MRRIRSFLLRLRGMFQGSRQEQDLNEEFESSLALHIEDDLRSGMPSEEARRPAILAFGSVELAKQNCRDRMHLPFLETFFYDLRYAARSLARSRIFTALWPYQRLLSESGRAPLCLQLPRRFSFGLCPMLSLIAWLRSPRSTVLSPRRAPMSHLRTLPNGSMGARPSPVWPPT